MASDRNDQSDVSPRQLRGFRRRWQPVLDEPSESGALGSAADVFGTDGTFDDALFEGSDACFDDDSALADWELLSDHPPAVFMHEGLKRQFESDLEDPTPPEGPQVLDPQRVEPIWKARAVEADLKRARSSLDKLPWEQDGSAFRSTDKWHGTILAGFEKNFTMTCIGAQDVWNSNVVTSKRSSVAILPELPVVPISLRKARYEPLDEDIRRRALLRFRDMVLDDPLSTQLGTSLKGRLDGGTSHEDIDQSFRDCFMMKASSTLQKRASSLQRLVNGLKAIGQLHPWRMSESQLYVVLCNMRTSGCGATSSQHVIEALHFMDATAKFTILDL